MKNLLAIITKFEMPQDRAQKLLSVPVVQEIIRIQQESLHVKIDEPKRRAASQIVHVLLNKLREANMEKEDRLICATIPDIHEVVVKCLAIDHNDYVDNWESKFTLEKDLFTSENGITVEKFIQRVNQCWKDYAMVSTVGSHDETVNNFAFRIPV